PLAGSRRAKLALRPTRSKSAAGGGSLHAGGPDVEAPPPKPSPASGRGRSKISILRTQLFDFGVAREIVAALAIDQIHHHALAVLLRGLADIGAKGRLVVDLAEGD